MKDTIKLGLIVTILLTLTACGVKDQMTLNETSVLVPNEMEVAMTETITASIVLQEEGKVLTAISKDVKSQEGQNLLEIMEENYDLKVKDSVISTIEGYKRNKQEGQYWFYTINGQESTVRAGDYIVKDQDVIVWNLDGI